MAEVLGIVTGVLGLLPLCRDGFGLIREVLDSNNTAELAVGRVEAQRDRFDQWREIWQDESGSLDAKFETFAKESPTAARRCLRQLALMSQAFYDVRALEKKYGFKIELAPRQDNREISTYRFKEFQDLTEDSIRSFRERCRANFSFITKCRFVLRKSDQKWESLINLLREYNENLRLYGPPFELQRMVKGGIDDVGKLLKDELRRQFKAFMYEAQHAPGVAEAKRYEELALAAKFTSVLKYEEAKPIYRFKLEELYMSPQYELSGQARSTMAILFDYPVKGDKRVVLVEWIQDFGHPDQKKERDSLALMLSTPKPGVMLLPGCYGVVDDSSHDRFGVILRPPEHIRGNLPRILPPGAISRQRMPVTLRDIIRKRHPLYQDVLDLGIRFRIAKMLVDAVHSMHSCGWIHKNIRSEVILFFPVREKLPNGKMGPTSKSPPPLEFDDPLFVGFNRARSDLKPREENHYLVSLRETKLAENITLDFYQHPAKLRDPKVVYRRFYDLYSLGCVLIEIGLWKTLDTLLKGSENASPEEIKKAIQNLAAKLEGTMGSIYRKVVMVCLTAGANGIEDTSKIETGIAARISQCVA